MLAMPPTVGLTLSPEKINSIMGSIQGILIKEIETYTQDWAKGAGVRNPDKCFRVLLAFYIIGQTAQRKLEEDNKAEVLSGFTTHDGAVLLSTLLWPITPKADPLKTLIEQVKTHVNIGTTRSSIASVSHNLKSILDYSRKHIKLLPTQLSFLEQLGTFNVALLQEPTALTTLLSSFLNLHRFVKDGTGSSKPDLRFRTSTSDSLTLSMEEPILAPHQIIPFITDEFFNKIYPLETLTELSLLTEIIFNAADRHHGFLFDELLEFKQAIYSLLSDASYLSLKGRIKSLSEIYTALDIKEQLSVEKLNALFESSEGAAITFLTTNRALISSWGNQLDHLLQLSKLYKLFESKWTKSETLESIVKTLVKKRKDKKADIVADLLGTTELDDFEITQFLGSSLLKLPELTTLKKLDYSELRYVSRLADNTAFIAMNSRFSFILATLDSLDNNNNKDKLDTIKLIVKDGINSIAYLQSEIDPDFEYDALNRIKSFLNYLKTALYYFSEDYDLAQYLIEYNNQIDNIQKKATACVKYSHLYAYKQVLNYMEKKQITFKKDELDATLQAPMTIADMMETSAPAATPLVENHHEDAIESTALKNNLINLKNLLLAQAGSKANRSILGHYITTLMNLVPHLRFEHFTTDKWQHFIKRRIKAFCAVIESLCTPPSYKEADKIDHSCAANSIGEWISLLECKLEDARISNVQITAELFTLLKMSSLIAAPKTPFFQSQLRTDLLIAFAKLKKFSFEIAHPPTLDHPGIIESKEVEAISFNSYLHDLDKFANAINGIISKGGINEAAISAAIESGNLQNAYTMQTILCISNIISIARSLIAHLETHYVLFAQYQHLVAKCRDSANKIKALSYFKEAVLDDESSILINGQCMPIIPYMALPGVLTSTQLSSENKINIEVTLEKLWKESREARAYSEHPNIVRTLSFTSTDSPPSASPSFA